MKKIFTLILIIAASKLFAQDVDVKKDMVFIDGKEVFKINGGAMSTNFSIENLDGKKLIFFKLDIDNNSCYCYIRWLSSIKSTISTKYSIQKNDCQRNCSKRFNYRWSVKRRKCI
jgi:hypothetical protein